MGRIVQYNRAKVLNSDAYAGNLIPSGNQTTLRDIVIASGGSGIPSGANMATLMFVNAGSGSGGSGSPIGFYRVDDTTAGSGYGQMVFSQMCLQLFEEELRNFSFYANNDVGISVEFSTLNE
jgi:hypothetical protein